MTAHRPRRLATLAAAWACLTLAVAACDSLTPGASDSDNQSTPAPVSTTITKDPVEITLANTGAPATANLIAAFQKRHPNVTIKNQASQFNDYIKSLKLVMTAADPPDIAEFNEPMKALIPAGKLLNLTPYAKAYGWESSYPAAALNQLRADKQAKVWGEGELWAVPGGGISVVGVYYNKKLSQQAGITVPPKTLAEFEAALGKAKAAGLTPLSVGALDAGGLHLWSAVYNVLCPLAEAQAWVYGKAGATLEKPCAVQASQKIIDWAKAGYIPKSATGTGEGDAATNFGKGQAVFNVNGNWNAAAVDKAIGANGGFFLMPGPTGTEPAAANGASVGFAASATTEHPDVVAAFFDFLRTPEAAKIQSAGGLLPVDSASAPTTTPLLTDIATAYKKVVADKGIIQFPDFAAPKMLDTLQAGSQGLILGTQSAEAFVASAQDVWDSQHT